MSISTYLEWDVANSLPEAFQRAVSSSAIPSAVHSGPSSTNKPKKTVLRSSSPVLAPSVHPSLSPYTPVAVGDRCKKHTSRGGCSMSTRIWSYLRARCLRSGTAAARVVAGCEACRPRSRLEIEEQVPLVQKLNTYHDCSFEGRILLCRG